MITANFIIILLIGTCAMLLPILAQMAWYKIKLWKSIPVAFILTITGTLGTYIWFFIENLWFGGRSFFGAVFIVPIVFILIAKLVCISYGELMDLCAPAECVMLALMKFQCLRDGCCGGRELFVTEGGTSVYFPSQIAELINALIVFIVLLVLSSQKRNRGKIYPWYLIIYGGTRFVLNFFRNTTPFFLGLSAGSFWSLCAIIIGVAVLLYNRRKLKSAE